MKDLLRLLYIKRFFFIPAFFFGSILLALILFYPNGNSFFFINGVHTSFTDNFFMYATHIGDGWTAAVIALLILVFYRYSAGICMLLGFGITGALNGILKNYVFLKSQRPTLFFYHNQHLIHKVDGVVINIEHSFPSGHTNTAFFVFTFLMLLRWKNEVPMQLFCVFCACVAAYSRVYLAQHFIGDVLGGMAIGMAGALFMYYIYRRLRNIKPLQNRLIGGKL